MADTIQQYQITQKGGPFALAEVPRPAVEPDEVAFRVMAVALNPLDYKQVTRGEMIQSWPAAFGLDAAGVVEEVGAQVTGFQTGDEVYALCGIGGKAAAFQEVVTVQQQCVAKKPDKYSLEQAASIPICYYTAASAILYGLHVAIPHISPTPPPSEPAPQLSSVLILGGASGVGSATIQLLREAMPDVVILATASMHHRQRLNGLGLSGIIDRKAANIVSDVHAAVPGGVDAIVDCLGAAAADPRLFRSLSPVGARVYVQVFTGDYVHVPGDVQGTVVYGRQVFDAPGGHSALANFTKEMDAERAEPPLPITVVGRGWDAVREGLGVYNRGGVSGQKLIVQI